MVMKIWLFKPDVTKKESMVFVYNEAILPERQYLYNRKSATCGQRQMNNIPCLKGRTSIKLSSKNSIRSKITFHCSAFQAVCRVRVSFPVELILWL